MTVLCRACHFDWSLFGHCASCSPMVMFYEVVTNAFMELGKCLCEVTFDNKDDDGLVAVLCAVVIPEDVANANLSSYPLTATRVLPSVNKTYLSREINDYANEHVLLTQLINLSSKTVHFACLFYDQGFLKQRDVRMIVQLSTLISLQDTQTFRNSTTIFHLLLCFTPMSLSKHVYAFIWHFYERLSSSTSTSAHISSLNKLVSVFFFDRIVSPYPQIKFLLHSTSPYEPWNTFVPVSHLT